MINLAIMSKEEYEERFDCSLQLPPVKYIICNPSQVENWHNIVVYEDGSIVTGKQIGRAHV